jgi:pantoate--beta-alanine ligase
MLVFQSIEETRTAVGKYQRDGQRVGLVPTMGALHEGHFSLVRAAKTNCDVAAVTIFVNPTQFGPNEDFRNYPRTLEQDLEGCAREGVDLVFTPTAEEVFTGRARTTVHVAALTAGLCGPHRPGHFDGVATIVAKLFHILPADAAFFGEKDYQQLAVIRRMVEDLNFPIEIVPCPTVREPDGLAMSSRNRYLTHDERARAPAIAAALFAAQSQLEAGGLDVKTVVSDIVRSLRNARIELIEYVEIVGADDLRPLTQVDRPARICVAARLGNTRLIDNVPVDAPRSDG